MSARVIWEVYVIERRTVHKPTFPNAKPFASLWTQIRAFRKRENAADFLAAMPRKVFTTGWEEVRIATYYRVRMADDESAPK